MTKTKSPTIDFSKRENRKLNAKNTSLDPGLYDPGNSFGKDVKTPPIGIRREVQADRSPGPGHYDSDSADFYTK